jgi:polyhydroxybutyrate depolymerase
MKALHSVPTQLAEKWCIDTTRIYMTGHSDGGTTAAAAAFLQDTEIAPRAIAPSAAGIRGEDMRERSCPAPLSVMTMQNAADELFPGYGAEMAAWWAHCNECADVPIAVNAYCVEYPGCLNGVATWLCEASGGHSEWPPFNDTIIAFCTRN